MANKWNFIGGSTTVYNNNGVTTTLTITASADNVRPSNAAYVAKWGNDTTGNGSRTRPYLTIAKANTILSSTLGVIILGEGVYREGNISPAGVRTYLANTIRGVEINCTSFSTFLSLTIDNPCFIGLTVTSCNTFTATQFWIIAVDCTFKNISTFRGTFSASGYYNLFTRCEFLNISTLSMQSAQGAFNNTITYNTFYNIRNLTWNVISGTANVFNNVNNVYRNCNIWISSANCGGVGEYSCYDSSCNWRFNASQGTVPTTLPPTIPSGYVNYTTLATLKAALLVAFPTANPSFDQSIMSNPLFNNESGDDLTLSLSSPIKNWSYAGSFIGCRPPALAFNFTNDITEQTNITVTSGVVSITSIGSLAQFVTIPKDLGNIYQLLSLPVFRNIAERNGEGVDYVRDISGSTISAGVGVLTNDTPYVVEGSAISWNSLTINVGDKFSAFTGQLDFTSAGGGVVREILDYPNQQNVEWRFKESLTGTISSGTGVLTIGDYYLANGSVTHNSITYTIGQIFKAINADFTGAGTVSVVFASGDTWYPFDSSGIQPKCNRVGNVSTGVISKGNADNTFDRTPANQFNVVCRYIQARLTIQPNNLI